MAKAAINHPIRLREHCCNPVVQASLQAHSYQAKVKSEDSMRCQIAWKMEMAKLAAKVSQMELLLV